MSDTANTLTPSAATPATAPLPDVIDWSEQAPKGGRTVLNRMLREGFTVPLFLGQTFVNSLRDVGYNNTVWAICEHVDNAIEWGAKNIRVYFHEYGRKGQQKIDVAILDDGQGMEPSVLRVAMSFGGSLIYGRRSGIGRFGVGMKTAALSMGPRLEVFSWQERGAIYGMTIDLEEIGASRQNLIELPEPEFRDRLPGQISNLLTTPMAFPKNAESQTIAFSDEPTLVESLSPHGTLVFIPECDRLSYKTVKSLVDHATKDMARIYRHFLAQGVDLYVNNRRVEPFDPTYSMPNARHTKIEGLPPGDGGRLINTWDKLEIPVEEGSLENAPMSVRLYALPIDAWYDLPRKILTNDLHIFEDHQVSFMRNHREVHIGVVQELSGKKHGDAAWLRIQLDFDGRLDEAFGISMTKQGVRPKHYALEIIRQAIKDDVKRIREKTAAFRAQHSKTRSKGQIMEAERHASETDGLLGKPLVSPAPTTEEEHKILEANLRALAITLKRDDETNEEAYDRLVKSKYVICFKHDEYWPFYSVEYQYGKVILTVNTAHAFYSKFYRPLEDLSVGTSTMASSDENDAPGSVDASNLLVSLQLILLSLARTQSAMTQGDDRDGYKTMLQTFQREWSANLNTQLTIE